MFCVECGKEDIIFKNGVCKNCYLKTHSFTSGPEILDLTICTHCGAYKIKTIWKSDLFDDVLQRLIRNNFIISKDLKKVNINTECKDEKDGKACRVLISGYIDDFEIVEEHDLLIRIKRNVCDVCSKKFGGYHEAIIQIRADKRKLNKEEINNFKLTVQSFVQNLQDDGNRSLFITDIGEERGGVDFFLSDKGAAFAISKKIHEQFGGIIKQSSKNMGMKDSRQMYRMTYLIRLPSYCKGDCIFFQNHIFYISQIRSNKIFLTDLSNWNTRSVDSKELLGVKVLGGNDLINEMILISQNDKEVQVMNPKNYKIIIIKKPKQIKFKSEKIKVIKIEDHFFLFPEKFKIDK